MTASSGLEAAPQARCPAEQGLIDLPQESTKGEQVLQALPARFRVVSQLAPTTARRPPEAPGISIPGAYSTVFSQLRKVSPAPLPGMRFTASVPGPQSTKSPLLSPPPGPLTPLP